MFSKPERVGAQGWCPLGAERRWKRLMTMRWAGLKSVQRGLKAIKGDVICFAFMMLHKYFLMIFCVHFKKSLGFLWDFRIALNRVCFKFYLMVDSNSDDFQVIFMETFKVSTYWAALDIYLYLTLNVPIPDKVKKLN